MTAALAITSQAAAAPATDAADASKKRSWAVTPPPADYYSAVSGSADTSKKRSWAVIKPGAGNEKKRSWR